MNNTPPNILNKEQIYEVIPLSLMKKLANDYPYDLIKSPYGFGHWMRVIENGLMISDFNNANKKVIIAFSVFHNIKRTPVKKDKLHAQLGADYLLSLKNKINLNEDEMSLAYLACMNHSEQINHSNKDIATCWDASRLDLLRLEIIPEKDKLNTIFAKDAGIMVLCNKKSMNHQIPKWSEEIMMNII